MRPSLVGLALALLFVGARVQERGARRFPSSSSASTAASGAWSASCGSGIAFPRCASSRARGTSAVLRTAYGPSPVIWTTMATGLLPAEHGITDFVVATPGGDVPVSSSLRRAPALWNMLSQAGRRVAVLGWWATWPAETVRGVVVTDRYGLTEDRAVSPAAFAARLASLERSGAPRAVAAPAGAGRCRPPRPRGSARGARARRGARAVRPGARSTSGASTSSRTARGSTGGRSASRRFRRRSSKRAATTCRAPTRRSIGQSPTIVAAAGGISEVNVLVVSDHGFRAQVPEEIGFFLDFDRVLERLGFLVRRGRRGRLGGRAAPRRSRARTTSR